MNIKYSNNNINKNKKKIIFYSKILTKIMLLIKNKSKN